MKKNTMTTRLFLIGILLFQLSGCKNDDIVKLDPKNPTTIEIWNYYTGNILTTFNDKITEFNDTVGKEKGIIVESTSYANLTDLEKEVRAAAKNEVGSKELPNIFSSYADTAYELEKLGILANIETYFSKSDQNQYINGYIEEGRIGLNGELRIFPIAKSTEAFMINETDWLPFATAKGVTYNNLLTLEGLADVSKKYYEYTDALTEDILNDGKAFFGRDSMANLFIIASKELGIEIFEVDKGNATINVNREIMKKIWDYYYIPFISGYYDAQNRFRSDDAKIGLILSYIGSTASASYFPTTVTSDGTQHNVTAKVLPMPHFEGGARVQVQQGAGMVVTKATDKKEFACVTFLKWFTDVQTNIEFAAKSSYLPVKKDANDYNKFINKCQEDSIDIKEVTKETLRVAFEEIKTAELYTNKAFTGGATARNILDTNLQTKAVTDRASVKSLLEEGKSLAEAVGQFNTEDAFNSWLATFTSSLQATIIE